MTISLGFYLDPNLTVPVSSPLDFEQATDGSTGPQVRVIYLGSSVANRKFENDANSGIDPIMLSVYDSQPNAGQEVGSVKLALDPNDLINTTPGQALALPSTILSGVSNAIPIYVQVEDQTGSVGTDTSLSLTTNNIVETDFTA